MSISVNNMMIIYFEDGRTRGQADFWFKPSIIMYLRANAFFFLCVSLNNFESIIYFYRKLRKEEFHNFPQDEIGSEFITLDAKYQYL